VIPFSMHLLSNCLPDLQDAAREIIMAWTSTIWWQTVQRDFRFICFHICCEIICLVFRMHLAKLLYHGHESSWFRSHRLWTLFVVIVWSINTCVSPFWWNWT
jgi:hypothetical protein